MKIILAVIIAFSIFFGVSVLNAETAVSVEKEKKSAGSETVLHIQKSITEEESIKVSVEEETESLYSEIEVEDLLEEIELFSETDYKLLDELFPEQAKAIVK